MISPNSSCPCGSKLKYKKCCQKYHKGALAKDALTLMRSRYSAYVAGDANYIIKTTHPQNSEFNRDKKLFRDEIKRFCNSSEFIKLEILEYIEGNDESYVTFKAILKNSILFEKSKFIKVDGKWLYLSGEFY